MEYPKRLIEVDLPIARISAHARREKSIRHGHISTLHVWWARRPLAACRAVICAALWPDPADPLCPQSFREAAAREITAFAGRVFPEKLTGERRQLQETASRETLEQWRKLAEGETCLDPNDLGGQKSIRAALLNFIADFANWDNSSVPAYLETSRTLTQAAHEALGGAPGTKPLVVDPFAGGGSIPLEGLRVGGDAFASDLNPLPVVLNKIVLEYIPKYGSRLSEAVAKWGEWIKREAERELAEFYPKGPDGATPIAYLWARTIQCEGPGCGADVPLIRSLWLARKGQGSAALQLVPNTKAKRVDCRIIVKQRDGWVYQDDLKTRIENPRIDGTVKRGSATCPCCGYTTPVERVREQLRGKHGGSAAAMMLAVRQDSVESGERCYRLPQRTDIDSALRAGEALKHLESENINGMSLIPDEQICLNEIRRISVPLYGMVRWGDLFSPRQALALGTILRLIHRAEQEIAKDTAPDLLQAVQTCLAVALNRLADFNSSLCVLNVTGGRGVFHTFGRQALPMVWDFMETNPFNDVGANWIAGVHALESVLRTETHSSRSGNVASCSATEHVLPCDSADAFVTDPPYYDAVPYSHLSDFFYVWLKRSIGHIHPALFSARLAPKDAEIVVDRSHSLSTSNKGIAFYESEMTKAFAEGRRVLRPEGIGTIVFASKTTASWEAILKAIIDSGLAITASWPIDTEREARLAAQGQARLGSSVHIVCRPRENADGSIRTHDVGDWRDVLGELPNRIKEWMPRLAQEGVVGADAIFACLGPALEIYSRYSRVEKANGNAVPLREYLEQVWGAVSTEALSMIFDDANAAGLEPDARLTAMWLWTLGGGSSAANGNGADRDGDEEGEEEEEGSSKAKPTGGFVLEFDAARKIAQGLGIHLEKSETIVEVKGDKARLLPVSERTRYLFSKDDSTTMPVGGRKKTKTAQMSLFAELDAIEGEVENSPASSGIRPSPGETVLDRVHQAMILFAGGRGEALRRFLVDDGTGMDARFWKLAQSLSALYPRGTEEKRWVDGVLARKKGLGL